MVKGLVLSAIIFVLGVFELYATYRYYHKLVVAVAKICFLVAVCG